MNDTLPKFLVRSELRPDGQAEVIFKCPACGNYGVVDEVTRLDAACWRVVCLLGSVLRDIAREQAP